MSLSAVSGFTARHFECFANTAGKAEEFDYVQYDPYSIDVAYGVVEREAVLANVEKLKSFIVEVSRPYDADLAADGWITVARKIVGIAVNTCLIADVDEFKEGCLIEKLNECIKKEQIPVTVMLQVNKFAADGEKNIRERFRFFHRLYYCHLGEGDSTQLIAPSLEAQFRLKRVVFDTLQKVINHLPSEKQLLVPKK
jgi:hypothetical protein